MPFVPIPNTVLVETRMTLDAQKVENTLYFGLGATPTPTVMTTLANDIITWWTELYGPNVTDAEQLREVVVTDLSSESGPQVTVIPSGTLVGSLTGEIMPNNVTLTVSFRTANRGRSFRGRNYVAGLTTDQVSGNTITSTVVGIFEGVYNALRDTSIITFGTHVVASRFSGVNPTTHKPIPRTTGVATPVTTCVIVDNIVDSQRRRLPGRGQ